MNEDIDLPKSGRGERLHDGPGNDDGSDANLNWVRVAGALLIVAGFTLGHDALGWLLTPDGAISSGALSSLVYIFQGVLMLSGLVLLVLPHLAAGLQSLSSVLLGVAGVLALVGGIASIGTQVAPTTDNRVAFYPNFSCGPTDVYCNDAQEAGLLDVKRYGKGAAFADIDGDGWVDLFAADAEPRERSDWGSSSFYLNNQDGTFRAVDLGIAEADLLSNWSGSFADMDNDGDQDLLLLGGGYAGTGWLSLYDNRMDTNNAFVSVTEASGLQVENTGPMRWWGVAWADYDNDGYLDFAVSRLYAPALLFRNNGDSTFANVTKKMGVETSNVGKRDGKNIVWFDYDNDGDLDLYLAGIEGHNLFENLEGKFMLDVTEESLADVFPENVFYDAGSPVVFAAAAADFDQDGREDLYFGRQVEQDLVLFNKGGGRFEAAGTEIGIDTRLVAKMAKTGVFENTMGLGVGDLLDDGWPDVIIGSGDPVRADDDVAFCNKRGRFTRCTDLIRGNADDVFRTRTHGIVFADVNQDGRTDVFQNLGGHAPWDQKSGIDSREHAALFVANEPADSNTAVVRLQGRASNRDAIGARIKSIAEETHYYTVRSTQAFQSQNEKSIIIALGSSPRADLEIQWPSGATSSVRVSAGERLEIEEPSSRD